MQRSFPYNVTYSNTSFPCSAPSAMEPVKVVKLFKSFPLEKKFPAPVIATIEVLSSSAASLRSYK